MKRWLFVLALALAAAGFLGCSIDADGGGINISFVEQTAPEWTWQGTVAAGQTVEIKGVNGSIDATPAAGGQVEVVVVRKGRSDPEKITIEVVPHAGGVTLCAMYPVKPGDEPNVCQPGEGGHLGAKNYNASASFSVRVPAGVHFVGRTVNGNVKAIDLAGNVMGRTVNGSVKAETDGYGQASTVNGSITVRMGRADWNGDLAFDTVNGSITLELPDTLSTEVRLSTVNGRITVDYPVTAEGEITRRHLRGVIGSGGRDLTASAVNGSVQVRKIAAVGTDK